MGDGEPKQLKSGSGSWHKHKSSFVKWVQALVKAHHGMRLVLMIQSPYSHDIALRMTNNVGGTGQEWEDAFVQLCGALDNREVASRLRQDLAGTAPAVITALLKLIQLGILDKVMGEGQLDWAVNTLKGLSYKEPIGECQ